MQRLRLLRALRRLVEATEDAHNALPKRTKYSRTSHFQLLKSQDLGQAT